MILITNGQLVDPAGSVEGAFDLLIEDGLIKEVKPTGTIAKQRVDKIIDAKGLWVAPGLVDLHVHFREPGFEWKETIKTGSLSAVCGGFTTVCCMANTRPVNDHAEIAAFIVQKGRDAKAAKVRPVGAVSVGLAGEKLAPLCELREAGCVAFSDDGKPIQSAALMRRALEWASMFDGVIACHEEDNSLCCSGHMHEGALATRLGINGRPTVAEDLLVARDIELARFVGARLHICHVSSARAVELIRRAKTEGVKITAEVTPHHLWLTDEAVIGYNTNAKMNPPLRTRADVEALLEGLRDGTLDAIATDHAPHELDTKNVEFDLASVGIIGLQTALPLVLDLVRSGKLSRMQALRAMTSGPARVFGLEAGSLRVGMPADITLIDPEYQWEFTPARNCSKSFNTPFAGKPLRGVADTVLVEGRVVVERRELKVL